MMSNRKYKLIEVSCTPADTKLRFAPCDKSFVEEEVITIHTLDTGGVLAREYGAKLMKVFRVDHALELPEPGKTSKEM